MRPPRLLLSVTLLFAPQAVWPQGNPVGPEFQINTYVPNDQMRPSVAVDGSGNFVVVWQAFGEDSSNWGIFGQRFASSGAPLGSEFQVNTFVTGNQLSPAIAADPSGNFVEVWHSYGQDGSDLGIFGQRYAASGIPLGSEFRVNTYTTLGQSYPAVAAEPSGNFFVAC